MRSDRCSEKIEYIYMMMHEVRSVNEREFVAIILGGVLAIRDILIFIMRVSC